MMREERREKREEKNRRAPRGDETGSFESNDITPSLSQPHHRDPSMSSSGPVSPYPKGLALQ